MSMIMKPFNGLYFCCWGITIAIILLIWFIFRNKSEKVKEIFMISFCGILVAFFFLYKYWLSIDATYLTAYDPPLKSFNWFSELPLHLCNINMFLIPIGVLTKKRGILGFSFFLAPLGASMAVIFPDVAFVNVSIFMPRMIGFYVTHFAIVIIGISLATLGFFKPRFKDFPNVFLTFFALALVIHCVNLLFVKTGICDISNYFFTMNDADISILKLFYKLIPVPFLYLLPALIILATYMSLVTLIFVPFDKCKKNESVNEEKELVNV